MGGCVSAVFWFAALWFRCCIVSGVLVVSSYLSVFLRVVQFLFAGCGPSDFV